MNKKVWFKNSKGDELCGVLSNPTDDKSKPIVILCSGLSSSKDAGTYLSFEKKFNNKMVSTFRFDFFGHGESDGKFEDVTVSEAADDIINAITFLKNKGYSKIGLVASSFGGSAAIIVASKTKYLFALGLRASAVDYLEIWNNRLDQEKIREWKQKGVTTYTDYRGKEKTLNYSFYADVGNIDAYKLAKNISIPTIIVHGKKDVTVPTKQAVKLAGVIPNSKLEILPNSDHYFLYPGDKEKCSDLIVDFFLKQII